MEAGRVPMTIIYEEVVEDTEQEFFHRSLWNWALGRAPWLEETPDIMAEQPRMPTTSIYEEVVEDREPRNGQEFVHRTLMDWTSGRLPWIDEALDNMDEQRREEEHRQQRHHEEEEPFRPALRDTTWAAAGSRLQTECAVCLRDFEAEDKVSTMPCDHCFHQGCIFEWLRVSYVCPLCRHPL